MQTKSWVLVGRTERDYITFTPVRVRVSRHGVEPSGGRHGMEIKAATTAIGGSWATDPWLELAIVEEGATFEQIGRAHV